MRHATGLAAGLAVGLVVGLLVGGGLGGCGADTDDSGGTDYVPQAIVDVDAAMADAAVGDPDAARVDAASDAAVVDTAPDAAQIAPDAEVVDLRAPFLGFWAQVQYQSGVATLPALGEVDTTTIGTVRLEIRLDPDDASGLVVLTETCHAEISREIDVVQTTIPPSFIEALSITERRARIDGDRFVAPSFIELRGVTLDDPSEPLPTEPADPRVLDLDRDGHPGLTVRVTGLVDGEVYLVQRITSDLDGALAGDTLDGLVGWQTEESVLGADHPALAMGAPLTPDPDPAASTFRSTRIAGDQGCAWILENAERVFAR